MTRAPKNKKLDAGDIATWTRERSNEEIHDFLGRRMSSLTLDFADVEEDEEFSLYDFATL